MSDPRVCDACGELFRPRDEERHCARRECIESRRKASNAQRIAGKIKAGRERISPSVMRRSPRGRG